MRFVNHTPWPHFLFERRDTYDRPLCVAVLQGTFAIESGKPLRALSEQEPVQIGDRYRGDPACTSPRRAGSLATFKPKSEVHVNAVARAPRGKPALAWPVRVRVGEVKSDLMVRGPSHWVHRPVVGWSKTRVTPCAEVELSYENAFGGSFRIDGELVEEDRNPVGTGFLPRGIDTRDPIRAPQVVAVNEPTHLPGRRYVPKGWGPVPSYFAPRCDRVGTLDARWLEEKWPCLPEDFDYAYHQSAHPDLVAHGYFRGDEPIELVHVAARGGTILTSLPSWRPFMLLRLGRGHLLPWAMRLDTVAIDVTAEDPGAHRAYLTWRSVFPTSLDVRQLEARMVALGDELRLRAA